jgi:hypothetical protein
MALGKHCERGRIKAKVCSKAFARLSNSISIIHLKPVIDPTFNMTIIELSLRHHTVIKL